MTSSGSTYYPFQLACDATDCNHIVVGHSKEHVKNKLKNHKKSKYCKGKQK